MLRFGTRGSPLARWQTEHVLLMLSLGGELKIIQTKGDQVLDTPLPLIGGKGLFTAELEAALHANTIQCAVHSLKDLPTEQPVGLVLGAILARAPVGDALISRSGKTLQALPQNATVGTSSRRRAAQLLRVRPDLQLTLVDSLRKRLSFLGGALVTLAIPDVTLIHTRAEELKNARFDLVTARAVAALPKLIGWCAPLVKPGGLFVAMKGAELEDDEGTVAKYGLTFIRQVEITLPDTESSRRNLLVWVK